MKKNQKDIKTSGFSSKIENEGKRLVNKDGSFNFTKTGVPFRTRFSLFHSLINMSIWKFIFTLLGFFIGINCFFALLYVALGVENLGLVNQSGSMQFLNAFFFSAQTITTVGYGAIAPTGVWPNVVASFEAFVGLMTFAMATGLLYGRFSKPRAKLLYSSNALISPYRGKTGLMFRIANARSSQMINVSAKVMFSLIEEDEDGELKRKFYRLNLEMDLIDSLPASWTIVHPIDENSPLAEASEKSLADGQAEILIALEGYDDTYAQQVHARSSYKYDEIIFNAKFKKIFSRDVEGHAVVALDEISSYETISV